VAFYALLISSTRKQAANVLLNMCENHGWLERITVSDFSGTILKFRVTDKFPYDRFRKLVKRAQEMGDPKVIWTLRQLIRSQPGPEETGFDDF